MRPRVVAIIPARAGSKRLPGKNRRVFEGKPLVQHAIDAALDATYVDRVLVTTDDQDIRDLANQFGNLAPFLRPHYLATDMATTTDVLLHALDYLDEMPDETYDYFVLLQPTSPLRTAFHIDEAIKLCLSKKGKGVISVKPSQDPPQWSNTIPASLNMVGFLKEEYVNVRKQDLEEYFVVNGAVYVTEIAAFRNERTVYLSDNLFAYKMSTLDSIDVDTLFDFKLAEFISAHKDEIEEN